MPNENVLLKVNDLKTYFKTDDGVAKAVDGVSFEIGYRETLAVVGESGSGKSVTSLSIMRLIPQSGWMAGGQIFFEGNDLAAKSETAMRRIRGNEIAMIFQDPMTSLNPVYTVGDQIAEVIVLHQKKNNRAARNAAVEMLDLVGIPEPRKRSENYPHQLSGGMRQRVMIATALSCNPKLLIADEPTTALDVSIQAQILELMKDLQKQIGMSMLYITHDLAVVSELADRILVMYAGRVVESAPVRTLYSNPRMPYTLGLLRSVPRVDKAVENRQRLKAIPGFVPSALHLPQGCAFHPRCEFARDECRMNVPALEEAGKDHAVRCVRWREVQQEIQEREEHGDPAHPAQLPDDWMRATDRADGTNLLEVKNLKTYFPVHGGVLSREVGRIHAVDDLSITIRRGEVVGLVGESGSGKTTAGRSILRLLDNVSGSIKFDGVELTGLTAERMRRYRKEMQIIFQDPFSSLNPRMTVGDIIGEGLQLHRIATGRQKEERVVSLLERVGLTAEYIYRYPHEFSGGQRQRIAIARALAVEPKFIVADEVVSALDVSIQAQILNLLLDLKEEFGLTLLFIAHDLGVVEYMSDRVIVMYLGRVMEVAPARELYRNPIHPYTESLLSAIPTIDPGGKQKRVILQGDIPSPVDPPSGCVFRTRCPIAIDKCAEVVPQLEEAGPGRLKACIRRTGGRKEQHDDHE